MIALDTTRIMYTLTALLHREPTTMTNLGRNPDTGQEVDSSILEDAGVAFDPTSQHLDLTKDEKRRTTALMLAINAYRELIIKEASYLREVADLARRNEGPAIQPATIDGMVEAACKFDAFIEGHFFELQDMTRGGAQTEASGEQP